MTTYNTGKVKIGALYFLRLVREPSNDEVLIQRGLLSKHEPINERINVHNFVTGIMAVMLVFVIAALVAGVL